MRHVPERILAALEVINAVREVAGGRQGTVRLIALLAHHYPESLNTDSIVHLIAVPDTTLRRRLDELEQSGVVVCHRKGRYRMWGISKATAHQLGEKITPSVGVHSQNGGKTI